MPDRISDEEMKQALERRPAPAYLKQRILAARVRQQQRLRRDSQVLWMRLAASLAIFAVLIGGGDTLYRRSVEQRKGEEARREVMTALRITSHTLNHVQEKLAAH